MATLHLQAGVDLVTISHLLVHASVETPKRYAAVNLQAKGDAVEQAGSLGAATSGLAGWREDPSILDWLARL